MGRPKSRWTDCLEDYLKANVTSFQFHVSGSAILATCMCLYVLRNIAIPGSFTDVLRLIFVLTTWIGAYLSSSKKSLCWTDRIHVAWCQCRWSAILSKPSARRRNFYRLHWAMTVPVLMWSSISGWVCQVWLWIAVSQRNALKNSLSDFAKHRISLNI